MTEAEALLRQRHAAEKDDVIAVVAGTRSTSGSTNFMRLHVVGSTDSRKEASRERRKQKKPG